MAIDAPPREAVTAGSWPRWFYNLFLILRGKLDAPYTVTLAAGATSTAIPNDFCNSGSQIILSPITATAAASTGLYTISGRETFTIHHNNTADTDKTFRYAIVG